MPKGTPCLSCGEVTTTGNRCSKCQNIWNKQHPKKHRAHYAGDYRKRAKQVRDTAVVCWLCGKPAQQGDPWTADHVIAGDPASPLAAAHRSCNSRRGNR